MKFLPQINSKIYGPFTEINTKWPLKHCVSVITIINGHGSQVVNRLGWYGWEPYEIFV